MKIVVVAAGKIRDAAMRSVADDYFDRVRRYVPFEEVEAKNDAALARAVPKSDVVVALEVEGRTLSSAGLARELDGWGRRGQGRVSFVLGGAEGIPSALSRGADEQLSLSKMTLPHRLARVVLAEQLYRAMTILRGEPYAREG